MALQRKGFAAPNDPILMKIAEKIPVKEITSSKTKKIIEKMLKFAWPEQGDRKKPVLVGLAAPQVKISKRIILVDVKADGHGKVGDLRVYINPEITWKSKKEAEWYEGCFSTDRVCGIVSRPAKVKIRAYTPKGKLVEESHGGYIARIFQHEIDHLNGKEFVTHITDDEKLHWVEDGQFPQYRDKEAWRTWSVKCPRERWEKIKGVKKFHSKVKILVEGYAKEIGGGWIATCNTTLIQTGKHNIVVDPGINKVLLLKNLKREGLTSDDIDYVFMTHYHPDHIFLASLFEKAKFFDGDVIYENDKETPYSGKLPDTNIEVVLTPGHAHEHASLIISTEDKGKVAIAADVFWWTDEEKQLTDDVEALVNKEDPFTKDWEALKASRRKVLEIADWVIPGHGKMFRNPKKKG